MNAQSTYSRLREREAQAAAYQTAETLRKSEIALTVLLNSHGGHHVFGSETLELAERLEAAEFIHRMQHDPLAADPVDLLEVPDPFLPAGTPITRTFPYHEVLLLHLLARQWRLLFIRRSRTSEQCAWMLRTAQLLRDTHAGDTVDLTHLRQLTLLVDRLRVQAQRLARQTIPEWLPPQRVLH